MRTMTTTAKTMTQARSRDPQVVFEPDVSCRSLFLSAILPALSSKHRLTQQLVYYRRFAHLTASLQDANSKP